MKRIRWIQRTVIAKLLIVSLVSFALAQPRNEGTTNILLPVRVNGKWGFINQTGRIVIRPRFSVATDFSEGRAWVRDENTWFYLIDETGKAVLAGQYYRYADRFSEGVAAVQGESVDDKIGFIDRSGKPVIPPKFDGFRGEPLWGFVDGLAIVESNGKTGYINRNGEFIIGPQFDHASPFAEGIAIVSVDGRYSYINRNGQPLFEKTFATAFGFDEGVASVSFDRQRFGLIDRSGAVVLEPKFDWISGFSEGLAPANIGMAWHGHQKSGGKWGFIDKTGNVAIEIKYDSANGFAYGLAPVMLKGKWGFIDKSGVFKIRPQFDWAEPFENGLSKVTLDEKIGYIDKTGKYVWKLTK